MSHVITRLKGGLGNQMFQYAAGYALATRLGVPLLIDRSHLDLRGKKVDWTLRDLELDVFRLPITFATAEQVAELDLRESRLGRLFQTTSNSRKGTLLKEKSFQWCESFEHCTAPALLDGFWQNERYFKSVADQLRNELFLPAGVPSTGNAAILQAIERQMSASVHIRRGDYVHDPVTAAFHGALPLAYYEEAAAWLIEKKGVEQFFVFSDDPAWVMEHLRLPREITVVRNNTGRDAHWDLHLMKHCAHHIVANSSFSWWGAWLDAKADKTVIAPKNWFRDLAVDQSGTVPSTWVHMMKAPTISVIMPAYNAESYLAMAVSDVLASTFTDFELIVLDDGSTDGTARTMAAFTDGRIRYVRFERNRGLVAVLNEGLAQARGEFIARMDADDRMEPERFQLQLQVMQADPGIGVLASFVDNINTDGELTGVWSSDREAVTEVEIRSLLPRTNCIAHPTVLIRRSALGSLKYDKRCVEGEDWDLWLRMMSRGHRIAKLPEVLVHYRQHPSSFTSAAKARKPLERRLLQMRCRFLRGEWKKLRFNAVHLSVLYAQARTLARHLISNVVPDVSRSIYRLLTYSPFKLLREMRQLREALSTWKGRHVFTFSYLGTGGAEQVHADIMATVADAHPLIVITGFSQDHAFAKRYAEIGTLLEIPRLLHHPFTAKRARQRITASMNSHKDVVLFGSNTDHFFAWLPLLNRDVKAIQLIHAFLHQPDGNVKHKAWLSLCGRIDRYVFISRQALTDFEAFLFTNNIPRSQFGKLEFIPNAVSSFGKVQTHERTGLLFVGRRSPEKRMDVFLALADRLEAEYPGRFRFTVVGAQEVPGHRQVAFKGKVNDPVMMASLYAEHDLLTLTSSREGFPMVVMEAMANGLVVLATPVGDVPNRLDPSFAVITTSVKEDVVIQEMVSSVLELDNDRERLQRMKAIAMATAQQEFNSVQFRERYRALLMSPAS